MKTLLAILLFSAASLRAQAPAPPSVTPASAGADALPLWRCTLPGGSYRVAVRAIVSVSSHEYVVDGAARVTEVNIDTTGSVLARFYFIEPNAPKTPLGAGQAVLERAQQIGEELADKSGQDAWRKVVKSYPTTTHARTVEYRLEKKEQLHQIFQSADDAFRLQRARAVTIQ